MVEPDDKAAEMSPDELRAALKASEEKLSKWKEKIKGIVENERDEIKQLRASKAESDRRIAELEEQVASSGTGEETDERVRRLEAEKEALVRERDSVAEDFERFKERTNVAMRLRGKELASKASKHSTLEEDLKHAQSELEMVKAEKRKRESELASLEEQAAEASLSVARQFELAAHDADKHRKMLEAEKRELAAEHREAVQEVRDTYEARLSELSRLHESELTQVMMRVDEVQAEAETRTQRRMDELLESNVELQTELDDLRGQLDELILEKTALATQQPEPEARNATPAAVKELEAKVQRLVEENEQQGKRIWVLQRDLIEAKDAAGELKEKPQTAEELTYLQQQSYLRAVIVSFMTAKSEEVRAGLIPILATLIQLSSADLKNIYKENPSWALTATGG